jgi:uncharacterized protein YbjT (DUF2867 family)
LCRSNLSPSAPFQSPSGFSDLRPGARGAQNVAVIDAAVAAGVGHIIFMSMAGTREEAEPAIGASYWVAEQRLIKLMHVAQKR